MTVSKSSGNTHVTRSVKSMLLRLGALNKPLIQQQVNVFTVQKRCWILLIVTNFWGAEGQIQVIKLFVLKAKAYKLHLCMLHYFTFVRNKLYSWYANVIMSFEFCGNIAKCKWLRYSHLRGRGADVALFRNLPLGSVEIICQTNLCMLAMCGLQKPVNFFNIWRVQCNTWVKRILLHIVTFVSKYWLLILVWFQV